MLTKKKLAKLLKSNTYFLPQLTMKTSNKVNSSKTITKRAKTFMTAKVELKKI